MDENTGMTMVLTRIFWFDLERLSPCYPPPPLGKTRGPSHIVAKQLTSFILQAACYWVFLQSRGRLECLLVNLKCFVRNILNQDQRGELTVQIYMSVILRKDSTCNRWQDAQRVSHSDWLIQIHSHPTMKYLKITKPIRLNCNLSFIL